MIPGRDALSNNSNASGAGFGAILAIAVSCVAALCLLIFGALLVKRRIVASREPHREIGVMSPLHPTNQRSWFHASHESVQSAGISCRLSPYKALYVRQFTITIKK